MVYLLRVANVVAAMKKKHLVGTVQSIASNNVFIIMLNSEIHWEIV